MTRGALVGVLALAAMFLIPYLPPGLFEGPLGRQAVETRLRAERHVAKVLGG